MWGRVASARLALLFPAHLEVSKSVPNRTTTAHFMSVWAVLLCRKSGIGGNQARVLSEDSIDVEDSALQVSLLKMQPPLFVN